VSARVSGAAAPRAAACGAPPFSAEAPPSAEAVELAWELGPDDFLVVLEGAELVKLRALHVGGCAYVFPLALTLPGRYRLVARAVRAGWASIDERGAHRPLTLDDLAGPKLLVTIGDARDARAARAAALAAVDECGRAGAPAPVCAGAPPRAGRWVRRLSGEAAEADMFAAPAPAFASAVPGIAAYFSELDRAHAWAPYDCCELPVSARAAAACFSDASVLFRGDSHLRFLYNSVMIAACGVREAAVKVQDGLSTCVERGTGRCAALESCLVADNFGREPAWAPPAEWPARARYRLAVTFGTWAASLQRARSPLAAYERELADYFAGAPRERAEPGGPRARVWVDMPPFMVHTGSDYASAVDWRTDHYVALYNAAAHREIQPLVANGSLAHFDILRIVDAFADFSVDGSHFRSERVQSVLVGYTLEMLCGPQVRLAHADAEAAAELESEAATAAAAAAAEAEAAEAAAAAAAALAAAAVAEANAAAATAAAAAAAAQAAAAAAAAESASATPTPPATPS
jgi:hypothetical protein